MVFNTPKGVRNGGRAKGTPNKSTAERIRKARIAEQAMAEVDRANGDKPVTMSKDKLSSLVDAFAGIAAHHGNRVATALRNGQEPTKIDLAGFEKWGTLAATFSAKHAEFESPKFKAIAVMTSATPNNPAAMKAVKDIANLDPVVAARTYTDLVKAAAPPRNKKAVA